jgi:hypothetical protein
VLVAASHASFVDCELRGGHALWPEDFGTCGFGGGFALSAHDESFVSLAASTLIGGNGGPPTTLSTCGGNGGNAVITWSSTVELRSCVVSPGQPDSEFAGTPAKAVWADESTLLSEGVEVTIHDGATLAVSPFELPTLVVGPPVVPGGAGTLVLDGPAGQSGLMAVTLASAFATPGHFDSPLWVLPQPMILVPVSLPLVMHFVVPAAPALSGVALTLQAVYPGLPGVLDPADVTTSNPDQLLIRH